MHQLPTTIQGAILGWLDIVSIARVRATCSLFQRDLDLLVSLSPAAAEPMLVWASKKGDVKGIEGLRPDRIPHLYIIHGLYWASRMGHIHVLERLLPVIPGDLIGDEPLKIAIINGHLDYIKVLLSHNALIPAHVDSYIYLANSQQETLHLIQAVLMVELDSETATL